MGKKAEKYTEKVGETVSEVLEMIEETVEAAAAPAKRKSRKKKEEEVAAPVKSKEELIERLEGLTAVLRENPNICGFCYTQLTDVEQEQNGLYYYDRTPKFDPQIFRKINSRKRNFCQDHSFGNNRCCNSGQNSPIHNSRSYNSNSRFQT